MRIRMPIRLALFRRDSESRPVFTPGNAEELTALIRAHPRVLAVGARTKPTLSRTDSVLISARGLRGIVEYDPGEYTFTALAGTPLAEIVAALGEKGQYLPFDPPLAEAGATIGGTVAAGLSGPGRFRFGGVRDFILAVKFADGRGELLRGGAKVVKNAAGFDLPKFFCGSMGRFGVLVELTFKVFPRPPALLTLRVPCDDLAQAFARIASAARSRWELDALDLVPEESALYARLGGPVEANAALAREIGGQWPGSVALDDGAARTFWGRVGEFAWADGTLVKVPCTLRSLPPLLAAAACRAHVSCAGDVAYFSPVDLHEFSRRLAALGHAGVVLRGECESPLIGARPSHNVERAVHAALDPEGRFADLREVTQG